MKFIVDAHLPKAIAAYLGDHDVMHTSELEDGNRTKDKIINSLSILELGNMRLRELKNYFERNAGRIVELLNEHSFLVLERENIRVLE